MFYKISYNDGEAGAESGSLPYIAEKLIDWKRRNNVVDDDYDTDILATQGSILLRIELFNAAYFIADIDNYCMITAIN